MNRPRLLTQAQESTIRVAIAGGATRDEAAAAAGITRSQLEQRLLDQLRDLRVGQGRRRAGKARNVDPTPEEIAERAAEVRSRWTEDEEYERRSRNFNGPIDLP